MLQEQGSTMEWPAASTTAITFANLRWCLGKFKEWTANKIHEFDFSEGSSLWLLYATKFFHRPKAIANADGECGKSDVKTRSLDRISPISARGHEEKWLIHTSSNRWTTIYVAGGENNRVKAPAWNGDIGGQFKFKNWITENTFKGEARWSSTGNNKLSNVKVGFEP
jgi:hypothetical protein